MTSSTALLLLLLTIIGLVTKSAESTQLCRFPETPPFGSSSCDLIRGVLQCSGTCQTAFVTGEEIIVLRCNTSNGIWQHGKDSFPDCLSDNCTFTGCENNGTCDASTGYCNCAENFRGQSCQYPVEQCEQAWFGAATSTFVDCEHFSAHSECSISCGSAHELPRSAATQYRCRDDGQIIWTNGDRESCQPIKTVFTCSVGSYGGYHVRSFDGSWSTINPNSSLPYTLLQSADSVLQFNVTITFDSSSCAQWYQGASTRCDRSLVVHTGDESQPIVIQISSGAPRVASSLASALSGSDVHLEFSFGFIKLTVKELLTLTIGENYEIGIELVGDTIRSVEGFCVGEQREADGGEVAPGASIDRMTQIANCRARLSPALTTDVRRTYRTLFSAFEHCGNRITISDYVDNLEFDYCVAMQQSTFPGTEADNETLVGRARCSTYRQLIMDTLFLGCTTSSTDFLDDLMQCSTGNLNFLLSSNLNWIFELYIVTSHILSFL